MSSTTDVLKVSQAALSARETRGIVTKRGEKREGRKMKMRLFSDLSVCALSGIY